MRVVLSPDPILRKKCEPIDTSEIKKYRAIAKDMARLMYKSDGCGIAAPQVGISKRLMVIDCTMVEKEDEKEKDTGREKEGERKRGKERDAGREREEEKKPPQNPPQNPTFYINPVVTYRGGDEVVDDEGCLSIPGISIPIKRFTELTVEALDLDGKTFEVKTEGFHARAIQHELDHLDGMTMFEHLDPIARIEAFKSYEDAVRNGAKPGDTGKQNAGSK